MKRLTHITAAALLLAAPAFAQDKTAELERKLDILTQEVERLKLGGAAEPAADKAEGGYAPAASKVYRAAQSKVSVGGYGELVYLNPSRRNQKGDTSATRPTADTLRAVLYVGYKFNDWILFNSEYEFEHAGSGEGDETRGEISVEQAYVDFKPWRSLGFRVGNVLVPMGLINESHEPTTFHGVNRPQVERVILPSTWHENGVGLFGEAGPVSFRTYLLAGLHGAATNDPKTEGFTGSEAIRGGRTGGTQTFAEDKAWTARVDLNPVAGVLAGASAYLGEADHNLIASAVPVTLWDVHAKVELAGLELRGLYAEGRIGNADELDAAQSFTDAAQNTVARKFFGGYGEAAYNVLRHVPATAQYLAPFVRYERYDTQWRTPGAFSKDPANSRMDLTLGLTYKPIPQLAVKLDQQWRRNQARTGFNQWSFGVGYVF